MTRSARCRVLLLALLLLVGASGSAVAQASDASSSAKSAAPAPSGSLLQYSLPPDKLEKAYALYLVNGVLYFVAGLWSVVVLLLMLRTRFGVRLRTWAERVSRFRFVQTRQEESKPA